MLRGFFKESASITETGVEIQKRVIKKVYPGYPKACLGDLTPLCQVTLERVVRVSVLTLYS
jgi:hypothetical protein